jgi:hypothetical protein
MRRILFPVMLFCFLHGLKSQIICGDTAGAVSYHNFIPDTAITDSSKVDLNNDNIADVLIISYSNGAMYHVDGWSITALNPDLQFCVRTASPLDADTISSDSLIDGQRSWQGGSRRLTRFESYMSSTNPPTFTQTYAGYYWGPADNYMGVRF